MNVHFDDFIVYHGKTNVVSADSYYPFGGQFGNYERTASIPQRFGFNGNEWMPELNLYDFNARTYDPWIPRFL
ncbi:MAG: RHS repeat-associated core domain-containing protein [Bacteroidota bacterium]